MADDDGYSFVKTPALIAYMSGIGLTADQTSALQDVLDGTQRELERYCRRWFQRKTWVEWLTPDEFGRLWPTSVPVLSVSDPAGLTPYQDNSLRGWSPVGSPISLGQLGGGIDRYLMQGVSGGVISDGFAGGANVLTTYIGGLDPDGDDIQDVRTGILRVAAREAEVRHDDTLDPSDLEARNPAQHDKRTIGWTTDELKKFDRLRRRTVR